jgi:hypothetical protein
LRLKRLSLNGKLLDVPHPFEEELGWLVSTNHTLVMENISRIEQDAVATDDEPDLSEMHAYSDELRKAANNLALVGLVTRFRHWVNLFLEELLKTGFVDQGLQKNLEALEKRTGEGPTPISFFQELGTLRDSIIHAESKTAWMRGDKTKQVAERYADVSSGEVAFTRAHLQEAIEKSIEQIKWYDERLDVLTH